VAAPATAGVARVSLGLLPELLLPFFNKSGRQPPSGTQALGVEPRQEGVPSSGPSSVQPSRPTKAQHPLNRKTSPHAMTQPTSLL
jgi:hypothetical protein